MASVIINIWWSPESGLHQVFSGQSIKAHRPFMS